MVAHNNSPKFPLKTPAPVVSLSDITGIDDKSIMGKHDSTLEAIRSDPIRANIDWRDIEKLFLYLGATVTEGRGSRERVRLNDVCAVFHRPHPRNEASKPMVKSVRQFLINAGVPE